MMQNGFSQTWERSSFQILLNHLLSVLKQTMHNIVMATVEFPLDNTE